MEEFGTLGGNNSGGYAINDSGQVTGQAGTIGYPDNNGDQAVHAFLWDGTTLQDLGTLGGATSVGNAINASGQIAGYAYITGFGPAHAFLWDGAMMQDLGTLGGSSHLGFDTND